MLCISMKEKSLRCLKHAVDDFRYYIFDSRGLRLGAFIEREFTG